MDVPILVWAGERIMEYYKDYIDNNVCTRVTHCFSAHECYFGDYFPRCEATRGISIKITLERAQKQFVTREHTLFNFFNDITNSQTTIKMMISTHRSYVSLAQFSLFWWRHNQFLMTSQWPDNCEAITWMMISNSLDIDFIHGDIHGRPCKKMYNVILWAITYNTTPSLESRFGWQLFIFGSEW